MHHATDKSWHILNTCKFPNLITLSLQINDNIIYIRKYSYKVYNIQGQHIDFIPWLLALKVLASEHCTYSTTHHLSTHVLFTNNILVRGIKNNELLECYRNFSDILKLKNLSILRLLIDIANLMYTIYTVI